MNQIFILLFKHLVLIDQRVRQSMNVVLFENNFERSGIETIIECSDRGRGPIPTWTRHEFLIIKYIDNNHKRNK